MTDKAPRLQRKEKEDLPASWQPAYEHVQETRNSRPLANVFATLANSPRGLEAVAAVGEYVRFHSSFEDQLRELTILTVAQDISCAYEWTHHYHIAEKFGVPADKLKAIGTPKIEQEPAPLGPTLKFARLVGANQEVDDQTYDALKKHMGEEGITELTVMVGYYGMLGRFINTTRVPLEKGTEPVPFSNPR
ncbi:MAG: hypothetical protein GEU28_05895 [Dehalococcoidia bacterium]|nr:hypothetical protein [Dehalococcoidia bacterium]